MLLPAYLPLQSAPFLWFVAGAWALDIFLGRNTREHADLDLGILRRDQFALQEFLADWSFQKVDAGAYSPWKKGEALALPVHEVHAQHASFGKVEILLAETSDTEWIYRRDARVRRSLRSGILPSPSGLSILAPEIVLLFKSKSPRPKDEADLQAVGPSLSGDQRQWLREALKLSDSAHPWLGLLGGL